MSEALILDEPPLERTLAEEFAALGEDEDHIEMVNLREPRTGVGGVLFVSSSVARHGPRVKWFARAGADQPGFSVSVEAEPRVLSSSLPPADLRRAAPPVLAWVELNHVALLRFWTEGTWWDVDEVRAFVDGLQRL